MKQKIILSALFLSSLGHAAAPGKADIEVKPPTNMPAKDALAGGAMPERVAPASSRENIGVSNTKAPLKRYSNRAGGRSAEVVQKTAITSSEGTRQ